MSEATTATRTQENAKSAENKTNATRAEAGKTLPAAVLPGTSGFDFGNLGAASSPNGDMDRNAVFTSLVSGDADITGLVAYSIYKQNKHDWLIAFNKHKSREPNEDELYAYIVGESTPRRLATYRHLAEATLDGRGPKVNMGPATEKFVQRSFTNAHNAKNAATSGGGKLAWIVAAVVAVAAILAAGKFGIPGLR